MANGEPEQTEGKAGPEGSRDLLAREGDMGGPEGAKPIPLAKPDEKIEMTPMGQAQAGATGGPPSVPLAQHAKAVQETGEKAHAMGRKQGFMDHPFESMFNLLAGGDQKLVGYRTSDDPEVKAGSAKVGDPIMQPRSKTEKWGAILAGALAGASKGYGPGAPGAALEAGMQTGMGIKAKEKTEAGEQYKRQVEAKREDIQNSLYTAEIAQRHALVAKEKGAHAKELHEADAPTKSMFDLNGVQPALTMSENKMHEAIGKDPSLLHKYMPIVIGVDNSDPDGPQAKYGFYRTDMVGEVQATKEMKDRWVAAGIEGAENIVAKGDKLPDGTTAEKGQDVNIKTILNFETQRHARDNEALRKDDREKHNLEMQEKRTDAKFYERAKAAGISLNEAKAKQDESDSFLKNITATNMKNSGITIDPSKPVQVPLDPFNMNEADLRRHFTDQGQHGMVPGNFSTLYAIGHYDAPMSTLTTQLRKGVPGMSQDNALNYIRQYINPNFNAGTFHQVQKLKDDFASNKPGTAGGNIQAFNTATAHLGKLLEAADALERGPGDLPFLNAMAQNLGKARGNNPKVVYDSIVTALAGELGKTFTGGTPTIPELAEIEKNLKADHSIKQVRSVIKANAELMLSKARENGDQYHDWTGSYPPHWFSESARQVYNKLGVEVPAGRARVGETAGSTGGGTKDPPPPAGTTQTYRDQSGKVAGWAVGGKFVKAGQ